MTAAYIVEAVRTAGRRRKGALVDWHPADMGGEGPNAFAQTRAPQWRGR